jgi:hypothetical protein
LTVPDEVLVPLSETYRLPAGSNPTPCAAINAEEKTVAVAAVAVPFLVEAAVTSYKVPDPSTKKTSPALSTARERIWVARLLTTWWCNRIAGLVVKLALL